jgi:hypothetical protein
MGEIIMFKIHSLLLIFCAALTLAVIGAAAQTNSDSEPAAASSLIGVRLPAGAQRVKEQSIPAEINGALGKIIAAGGNGKLRQGETEVLVWLGGGFRKSNAAGIIKQVTNNMQSGGWSYAVGEQNAEFIVFNALDSSVPKKRAIIGFWIPSNESLILAWTEMLPTNSSSVNSPKTNNQTSSNASRPTNTNDGSAKVVNVEKDAQWVNVMGNEMPRMPQFPALAPKPNKVRGYVKDWAGKPLAGATLGIRASYFAGQYSGAQGTTDANGYYEFVVPKGSAHFYNAGYQIEWGDGVAGVALHPADGKVDSFTTADGGVENFVLLPYGITSRENLQQSSHLPSTFYGGAIFLNWYSAEANNDSAPPFAVKEGAMLEVTLTPEGKMLDGSAGQTIVIRKTMSISGAFRIHNIPIGRYRINIKANGKPLKIKDSKQYVSPMFGMTPGETIGGASILFVPDGAKASMMGPQFGSWKWISLNISTPE